MDNKVDWSKWVERWADGAARVADVVKHTAQRAYGALRADYVKLQEQRREDAARAERRNRWDERRVDQRRHAEDKRSQEERRVDGRRADDRRRDGARRGEATRQDDRAQERHRDVGPAARHEQPQRIEQRESAPENPEGALRHVRSGGARIPARAVAVGASHEAERERPSAKVQAQLNAVSSHTRPAPEAEAPLMRPEPELAVRRLAREWSSTQNAVQAEMEGRFDLWGAETRVPTTAELRAWSRLHDQARSQGLDPAHAPFPDPRQVPEWNVQLQADHSNSSSSSREADVAREIQGIDKTLRGQHTLAALEVQLDQMRSGGLDMFGRPSEEHGYITPQMRWLDGALETHSRERVPAAQVEQAAATASPPHARARGDDGHCL